MYLKNLQTVFTFITFALLALSSPVRDGEKVSNEESIESIKATNDIKSIAENFSITEFEDNGTLFDIIDANYRGPLNDEIIVGTVMEAFNYDAADVMLQLQEMGSSAFSIPNKEGNGYYFGRNFDSEQSNTLVFVKHSEGDYSSISTVNLNFINQISNSNVTLPEDILKTLALLSPVDGMNEKGLSVSVGMLKNIPNDQSPDFPEIIDQSVDYKFNITTTTLVRFLLDNASSANEAIKMINVFNLHGNSDMNVHYVITDITGKTYVVEYIHNEVVITETSVATDFYIAEGEYHEYGIGLERYNTINEMKNGNQNMNAEEVKSTLAAVKEKTQWSVVYDLLNKEATYYIKENYDHGYKVKLDYHQDEGDTVENDNYDVVEVEVSEEIKTIPTASSLKVTEFRGDDGIDAVLKKAYFEDELELFNFILDYMNLNTTIDIKKSDKKMACSAFSVQNEEGDGYYFGRNYDFADCEGLILVNHPTNGYASISTVDTDFISWVYDRRTYEEVIEINSNPDNIPEKYQFSDDVLKTLSLYLPIDGVNEEGLSISVNAVSGEWEIVQKEDAKYKMMTSSIIRIMLDKAKNVDEALELLKSTNMRFVFDLPIHYVISDAHGNMVAVEYSDEDIHITKTQVVTNSYVSSDEKFKYMYKDLDILYDKRYEILSNRIAEKPNQSIHDVRNTLRSGIQGNTQWSIIYDQSKFEALYFSHQNFDIGYHVRLFEENSESSDEEETLYYDEDDIEVIKDNEDDDNDDDDQDRMTEVN